MFVAHYGFRYDFPLLFTEMERNEIDFNVFEENGVLFCDTCKNFKVCNIDAPRQIKIKHHSS